MRGAGNFDSSDVTRSRTWLVSGCNRTASSVKIDAKSQGSDISPLSKPPEISLRGDVHPKVMCEEIYAETSCLIAYTTSCNQMS